MNLGLKGKVALVTGGSDGIGLATALELAREGADVIICARNMEKLSAAALSIKNDCDVNVNIISCDITSSDQIDEMFKGIISKHRKLDILVNNAGTSSAGHFEDTSDQIWEADIELKLYGAIRCSRNVIPIMKKNGGGRIVNITTPGGKAPTAASVPTSVTRAAGIALTKGMSKDLAADNILVNTVCVGLLKSGQHRTRWEKANASDPTITIDNFYQDMATRVPMGRVGEASEVGGMIAFLVSDRGSYITGASINIDGGMSPVV